MFVHSGNSDFEVPFELYNPYYNCVFCLSNFYKKILSSMSLDT